MDRRVKLATWTRAAATIAVVAVLALVAPIAAAAAPASSAGVGDPYYPQDGNPGYDVTHYGLDLTYDPGSDTLGGTAVVTATARQKLTSFALDLDGLTVSSVTVNARAAKFSRADGELTITPKSPLTKNLPFVAVIRYSGIPVSLEDAGFIATDDGAVVIGQPHVASSWFPVNDHPIDKALYTVRLTVPKGLEAISNGRLVSQRTQGASSVWLWNMDAPMASYLATATIGNFEVDAYRAGGIRYWDAVDPDLYSPAVTPHTGSAFAYSQQGNDGYKRLQRTVTVAHESPRLSLWADRDIEDGYDFAFVEVAPTGTDTWTTLPDTAGIFTQDAGYSPCADLLAQHPFLAHYLSGDADPCAPTGTTGQWWAATGSSGGWEQWSFDLSTYAGTDVDIAITYLTDYTYELRGLSVDDVSGPGGDGSTSFEADIDPLDGWTVPGAPEGSPGNLTDWEAPSDGPPTTGSMIDSSFSRQPEIVSFLADRFGPYPFGELGGIVDDVQDLGFALEIQTRPIYSREFWTTQADGDSVVVHEVAHQWFGDSVALKRWSDIWLNEGFATYAEWLWSEHEGGATPQQYFDYYAGISESHPFWSLVIGDPGPDDLFAQPVYLRGAMAVHALRTQIGDDAFWTLLKRWTKQNKNGNATMADFIALAEKVSGQQLDDLFQVWLFTGEKPAIEPAVGARSFGASTPQRIPEFVNPHQH